AGERALADSFARLAGCVRHAGQNAAPKRGEGLFRRLIEHAQDMIVMVDEEGTALYGSPSVRRVLGYDPEVMNGTSLFPIIHPDDLPRIREWLTGLAAEPSRTHRIEYRFLHREGHWVHLEAVSTAEPDYVPGSGYVINIRDTTERRRAEEELRRSEERFRTLTENAHDIIVVVDGTTGRLLYQSPSMQRILGYAPQELEGRNSFELVHPEDVEGVLAAVREAMADPGSTRHAEYRYRHRDGSWRHLETFGRTLQPATAAQGLVFNTRDVTERREAELALRQSESMFRHLVESAQDMITVVDATGIIRFQSPSARRILGFEPEEMVGADAFGLVHPDDIPAVQERFTEVFTFPGTATRVLFRFRHKDGSWRHVESYARTVLPDTVEAGALGVVRDITERVEADAALRRAKAEAEEAREEAERANRAKSEFLGRMSHELRTPLNSILGFAQVLEDLDLPSEYQAGVRYILKGGRHLLSLINEVLDMARIEAHRAPMSLEPVRIGAVIHDAVDMVRPLAAARGIEVAEAPDPVARGFVHADRQRLAQVLLNLLSNAVKYNRPGGIVRVGSRAVRDADGAERVRIRVEDQGAGIPADQRDQLFVPFARLGAEHSSVEGTGLGLALSQRLARAMGGELELERSGPTGSVFYVELRPAADPLADAPGRTARAGSTGSAAEVPEATLLYVEDNLANLTLVETILIPRPGWRVLPALQGRLGLELAAEHVPDVILLDLHLPDIPGREVLRLLRADPRTARTPVVVISADSTPRTVEALLGDGADAFLTKPLDVREFLATVERVLARTAAG
ncbi:MAG TPA: PAS domain S-box protein, partial [Longimicrobium sp.]|nr:PAS domain S-box protein [Longimicrobium sp.]